MEQNIEKLFEKLTKEIIKYNPYYDKRLINKAFLYAYEAHKNQKRASWEPYIIHSIFTAINLTKIEADDISIVCALLHDVLYNKDYTLEDIEKNFWEEITKIISWVSKLWEIYYIPEMSKQEVEKLKLSLVSVWDDIRIFLVKIADRFHNLETLDFLPKQKRYRIARETEEIYLPIVNFLSIWEFLVQMNDLCFKYTNEKDYKNLDKIFWKKYDYYKNKIIEAHNKVEEEFKKNWLKIIAIEWRVKSLYSIWRKITLKNIDINDIYDVLALRIITKNIRDAYIALWIIHKIFNVKNDRFKDYISSPKENWYQSIHTTVFDETWEFLEFQIQTAEMMKLNKSWLAAHFIYKWFWVEYRGLPEWMKWILDIQKKTIDTKWFFEKLTHEIIISEIKCFDTNGNFLLLPKESVLLDYAFNYNFDNWKYFSWAYVNGVFTNDPFFKLKNGDFIRLQKSNKININSKIENFFLLKTQKARDGLKELFKKYSSNKLIELWKFMLNNALETYSYRHFSANSSRVKKEIIKSCWLKNEEQFFLFLWLWSIEVDKVIQKMSLYETEKSFNKRVLLKIKTKSRDFMSVNNITKVFYDLELNVKNISYKEDKNVIFVYFEISSNQNLQDVLKELQRVPNVANIYRMFPFRLKLYYTIFSLSIFILLVMIFLINTIDISKYQRDLYLEILLFWSSFFMLFIAFFIKFLVKTILPDVLRYKRFWWSLFLLNTFIFVIIFWEILFLGFKINFLLYSLFCLFIYVMMFYEFLSYRKYYKK